MNDQLSWNLGKKYQFSKAENVPQTSFKGPSSLDNILHSPASFAELFMYFCIKKYIAIQGEVCRQIKIF